MSAHNVMGLKSCKSPNFRNFGIPNLKVPKKNDIWVLASWLGTTNIIRGKMVAFPKFEPWWVLCEFVFARDSSVHQKCSNYALINLLFGLCKFVSVIDLLVTHPSPHPKVLACPSTPKMLWAEEHATMPYPSTVFHLEFTFESIKGVCHMFIIITSWDNLFW